MVERAQCSFTEPSLGNGHGTGGGPMETNPNPDFTQSCLHCIYCIISPRCTTDNADFRVSVLGIYVCHYVSFQ